jgi:anti-anti-sigma regulatory factor
VRYSGATLLPDTAYAVGRFVLNYGQYSLSKVACGANVKKSLALNVALRVLLPLLHGSRPMFCIQIDRLGELAVIECESSIDQSTAAISLRDAVTSQQDARVIVIDLSELTVIENQSLGMLALLQKWAADRGIGFRLFNPGSAVRDRLEHTNSMQNFEIASLNEMRALLRWAAPPYGLAA